MYALRPNDQLKKEIQGYVMTKNVALLSINMSERTAKKRN